MALSEIKSTDDIQLESTANKVTRHGYEFDSTHHKFDEFEFDAIPWGDDQFIPFSMIDRQDAGYIHGVINGDISRGDKLGSTTVGEYYDHFAFSDPVLFLASPVAARLATEDNPYPLKAGDVIFINDLGASDGFGEELTVGEDGQLRTSDGIVLVDDAGMFQGDLNDPIVEEGS